MGAHLRECFGDSIKIGGYDDNGKFILSAYFDKESLKYDVAKGKVIVPASGIKIVESQDNDGYEDDEDDEIQADNTPGFKGSNVLYMSFTKRMPKNLHYVV